MNKSFSMRTMGLPVLISGIVVALSAGLPGCGGENPAQDVTETADAEPDNGGNDADTSVSGDVEPDVADDSADLPDSVADMSGDDTDSVSTDADSNPEVLTVPYETPPCTNPYVESAFPQEFNHAGIEIDRRIPDVRDIVIRPAGAPEWFDAVTLVGPAGFYRRGDTSDLTGQIETFNPDAGFGEVLGAAFSGGNLYVVARNGIATHDGSGFSVYLSVDQEHSFTVVSRSRGWTLAVSDSMILGFTPTGVFNLTPAGSTISFTGAAVTADNAFLVVTGTAPDQTSKLEIYEISNGTAVGNYVNSIPLPVSNVRHVVTGVTIPKPLDIVAIGSDGMVGILGLMYPSVTDVPEFADDRVPLAGAFDATVTSDGGFVVATEGGVYRMISRDAGPEWRLYNTLRWVAHETVHRVVTTPEIADSPVYFGSAAGMTWVTVEKMDLKQKIDLFIDRVVLRHDRDGAVADSRQTVPGDLSTNIPWDSDNDGGWTCYWVLAECFRWKATGDPEAKAHFDKSLQAMLNLRLFTGTDYFLARSLIRIDGCRLDDCDNPDDGEWFKSPDGEWWVKSDTSNDEVTSHMFMMGPAYDLCADETQKQAIREHVTGIVSGIIDHGYQLWKPTGECTTYGQFDPFYINSIGMFGDGGRRSAQMLAALNLALHVSGDPKFAEAKRFLIEENNYAENAVHESEAPGRRGHGDGDELAMQAFFALLRYETDPKLFDMWVEGWYRTYSNIKLQQAALWDVINGVLGGQPPDYDFASRWLKLVPMDLIRWPMHNSHRLDLVPAPPFYSDRDETRKMRSDGYIIPPDERPNERHNTNQYGMDGGWGSNVELDGADVVAAYWIARYFGFIVPESE